MRSGLTEPTVQDYGASDKQSEILVELPGVDDPARVKDLIGPTAQLKIVEVKNEGPVADQEEALAAKGGILPLDTEVARLARRRRQWLGRLVSGLANARDHRPGYAQRARRAPIRIRRAAGSAASPFRRMARRKFGAFTGIEYRKPPRAWCWTTRSRSVATIQSSIDDHGPHQRAFLAAGSLRSAH